MHDTLTPYQRQARKLLSGSGSSSTLNISGHMKMIVEQSCHCQADLGRARLEAISDVLVTTESSNPKKVGLEKEKKTKSMNNNLQRANENKVCLWAEWEKYGFDGELTDACLPTPYLPRYYYYPIGIFRVGGLSLKLSLAHRVFASRLPFSLASAPRTAASLVNWGVWCSAL